MSAYATKIDRPLVRAKNERENVEPDELLTLREIGAGWLAADARRIAQANKEGILQEVTYDDEENAT